MRVIAVLSSCLCMLAVVANGGFLADPNEKRNKLARAQKELRLAEAEVRDRTLAVRREQNYTERTNATLASLWASVNRAKKDRKDAKQRVNDAAKNVKKHKHKR
mmetsp:Transcript_57127/g.161269  ORF Transcript_57127/g.161269 Transcript_57127/m.161269 type:complete len:104 (-) Transcript_57127:92-403(-)